MIRLGIIGTGGMANAHAKEFLKIKGVQLVACCDIAPGRATDFGAKYGIEAAYTDYRDMLARERLDAVTNVTIDAAHAETSLACIRKGLHILCEKPLATSLADAKRMAAAAAKAGVINMVNFSYRNSCALQQAAKEIRRGKIGRVMHVESSYLQSWIISQVWGSWRKNPGLAWRLSTRHGSAGVLGDLGCHIYDMTTLLVGDIDTVDCRLRTFKKGVRGERLGQYVLDANDSFAATVTFAGGGLGVVHSTRWATGQVNSLRVRVHGDKGAIDVDLDRSYSEYRLCFGRKAIDAAQWQTVKCPATPNMYQRFIRSIRTGKNDPSDFANGAKVQAYLHYSFASNDRGGVVKVKF